MKVNLQEKEKILSDIFKKNSLISANLSKPRKGVNIQNITIRPIEIKGEQQYQITELKDGKAIHKNFMKNVCLESLKKHLDDYMQVYFYTLSADYHFLFGKKGNLTILKKDPTKSQIKLSHNRQKKIFFRRGISYPFFDSFRLDESIRKSLSIKNG